MIHLFYILPSDSSCRKDCLVSWCIYWVHWCDHAMVIPFISVYYLFACRNYQSCYEAITNAQSTRLQSWLPTSSESNSKMTNPNCRAFRMLFVLRLTVF